MRSLISTITNRNDLPCHLFGFVEELDVSNWTGEHLLCIHSERKLTLGSELEEYYHACFITKGILVIHHVSDSRNDFPMVLVDEVWRSISPAEHKVVMRTVYNVRIASRHHKRHPVASLRLRVTQVWSFCA